MNIKPFKSGEKICFIGDSITAATYWIAHIADYYSQNTAEQIELYPCGIGGGNCESGYRYFADQTAPWQANTAVIKLGMNDIGRGYYGKKNDLEMQKELMNKYKDNLLKLIDTVKAANINRIILLAPTPYDEINDCEAENYVGCMDALRDCAKVMEEIADNQNLEFYDLGGQMFDLLKKGYAIGNKNPLINGDRVHPTELGHSVMARLFLTAQGFKDLAVTAQDIAEGKAALTLSEKAQTFFNVCRDIQNRWTADWLVADFSPDKTKEGKLKFIKEEYLLHPEKYGNYKVYGAYFVSLAQGYEDMVMAEEQNKKALVSALTNMFKR
ncbi:MAG: hypothetical protein IJF58_04730 [Clostridia bacterium]|nr:hypothetical protein [Clostridia bacterium]